MSMQVWQTPAMRAVIQERDDALEQLEARNGVTVCIPYYNEEPDVVMQAIGSVAVQTVAPLEVIVVDDGSEKPFECDLDVLHGIPCTVVRQTNRGLPSARNTGLMLAKGSAFLPLDSDDMIDPKYIERTLPLLHDHDVVLVGLQEHGPTRNGTYMPGYDRPWQDVTEATLWEYNRFFYCSLFRTQLLREVGGYHPRLAGWPGVAGGYEDWDMWIDLLRRRAKITAVNEVLFHYTTRPDSMLSRAEANRYQLVEEMMRHHQHR